MNIQRHREKKTFDTSFGICSWQEPLGPSGQKTTRHIPQKIRLPNSHHLEKLWSTTWGHDGRSYLLLVLVFVPGPTKLVLLSLLLLHLRLITHSCTYAKETNSEQVRSLPVGSEWRWYNNQSDCHWVTKRIPPLPSYNSGAETCKRISVGTSSTHWILKRCQVQTLSLNAVTQPSTDTSGINVHGNATEHSQCELPTCGQIEIHLYRALSQTSLSKTHSHEQGNLDRTYNTWPNHAPIDTPSPG